MNVINETELEEDPGEKTRSLAGRSRLLRGFLQGDRDTAAQRRIARFSAQKAEPTKIQQEMFYLALYVRYYEGSSCRFSPRSS